MVRTRARRYSSVDLTGRADRGVGVSAEVDEFIRRNSGAFAEDQIAYSVPPGRDPSSRAIAARVNAAVDQMYGGRNRRHGTPRMLVPGSFGGFPDQGPMGDPRSDVPNHRTIELPLTGTIGDGSLTSNRNAKIAAAGLAGAGLAWLGKKIYDRVKSSSRKKAGPVRGNLLIVISWLLSVERHVVRRARSVEVRRTQWCCTFLLCRLITTLFVLQLLAR